MDIQIIREYSISEAVLDESFFLEPPSLVFKSAGKCSQYNC